MSCFEETTASSPDTADTTLPDTTLPDTTLPVSDHAVCNSCNYTFIDRTDQVLHYKLDWHLYNVKQSLRTTDREYQPISEHQFNEQCDDNDLSSLSGSDDENDVIDDVTSTFIETSPELTTAVISRPHIVFRYNGGNSYFKCLHSLLFSPQTVVTDTLLRDTLTQCTVAEPSPNDGIVFQGRVGVFLYSAQHFAGAVYEGETLLLHKTYHRYTVRAKQGTVQGIRDGKGNAPKSFGASLRRYNQIAMFNDIEKLLLDWSDTLNGCHAIFHRTAVHNRNVFDKVKEKIGDKKHKFRTIPFTTYRPTLKETGRVHKLLVKVTKVFKKEFDDLIEARSLLQNESSPEPQQSQVPLPNPKSIPNSHLKQRPQKQKADTAVQVVEKLEAEQEPPFYELEENIFYKLISSIEGNELHHFISLLSSDSCLNIDEQLKDRNTLLHFASLSSDQRFIKELLCRNANPELKNDHNRTPYEIASSKESRDEFRRFMAEFPDKWDYKLAKVPSPLTPQMEEDQNKKKQEKKKQLRAAKALRDKQKKAAAREAAKKEEDKLVSDVQKLRSRQLTARERCLLAAEARLAAESGGRGCASGSCDGCGTGLDGLVPFERLQFKYCSVTCVKEHRQALGE